MNSLIDMAIGFLAALLAAALVHFGAAVPNDAPKAPESQSSQDIIVRSESNPTHDDAALSASGSMPDDGTEPSVSSNSTY